MRIAGAAATPSDSILVVGEKPSRFRGETDSSTAARTSPVRDAAASAENDEEVAEKQQMNVLMVSLDTTCLADQKTARSDTLLRHMETARRLSHFHVVIFSVGKARQNVFRPSEKLSLYPTQSLSKALRPLDAVRIAARICRTRRIDVVTTQDAFFTGMVGWAIKSLFRIPLNVQVHADCIGNPCWIQERLLNRLLNVTGRAILRAADNVRVVSASEKEKMIRLGIAPERVWNVPEGGGIDIEKFSSGDGSHIRRKYLLAGCDRMVFFAGRVTKQKRVQDLLYAAKEVLKELPGVVFLVAGEGSELPAAKALCSRLRLDTRVVFLGNVPYDEMPDYFAAADVFALPSAYEGTARVLMESFAAGLPIITTRVSGISDFVVDGENGHIVSVGRPRVFADRLVTVLKNVEHYRRGAARRKSILEFYDRKKNLPRVVEVWAQVAKRNVA